MLKQWIPVVIILLAVATVSVWATVSIDATERFAVFGMLAAGSLAAVSVQHLLSARAPETVRQMVYASAGSLAIMLVATGFTLLV